MQGIAIHGPRPRADVWSRLADLDERADAADIVARHQRKQHR